MSICRRKSTCFGIVSIWLCASLIWQTVVVPHAAHGESRSHSTISSASSFPQALLTENSSSGAPLTNETEAFARQHQLGGKDEGESQADGSTTSSRGSLLKGKVSTSGNRSPLLYGSVQNLPKGVSVNITLMGNINSEVSQKGDEVWVRIAHDVKSGAGVLVPGQWFMHGMVTDVASQRRLGRDGYVEIEFDKLLSPDGEIELPFNAKVSTKDKLLKSVAKTLVINSGYVAQGAAGGALLSAQLTGIPLAVASHGYSIAIGAGVGATVGVIGALKRKGKIASIYPGDELKLVTAEPILLPCFNLANLPSAKPTPRLKDLNMSVHSFKFGQDPFGDKKARILRVDVAMDNNTKREYSFFDLAVVSDRNQRYYPSLGNDFRLLKKKIEPLSFVKGTISFSVDSPKHKYWLVLLDRLNREELARVPIN